MSIGNVGNEIRLRQANQLNGKKTWISGKTANCFDSYFTPPLHHFHVWHKITAVASHFAIESKMPTLCNVILLHNWLQSQMVFYFLQINIYELFSLSSTKRRCSTKRSHTASFRGQMIENHVWTRLNTFLVAKWNGKSNKHVRTHAHTHTRDDSLNWNEVNLLPSIAYTHQSANLFVGNIVWISFTIHYAVQFVVCSICVCCLFDNFFLSQVSFGSKQETHKNRNCDVLLLFIRYACRWLLLFLLLYFFFHLKLCIHLALLAKIECALCMRLISLPLLNDSFAIFIRDFSLHNVLPVYIVESVAFSDNRLQFQVNKSYVWVRKVDI